MLVLESDRIGKAGSEGWKRVDIMAVLWKRVPEEKARHPAVVKRAGGTVTLMEEEFPKVWKDMQM